MNSRSLEFSKFISLFVSLSVLPFVSNAFVKWLETGKNGGCRVCKGGDASMVCYTNLFSILLETSSDTRNTMRLPGGRSLKKGNGLTDGHTLL